jgi:hypothetical protein
MTMGLNSNYCQGWQSVIFTVTLNAFMDIWCTEASTMHRIKGPNNAPRVVLNS